MHAWNANYIVEIGVQGQCTISCRNFQVIQMVHAVKEGPEKISQFSMKNLPN